MIYNFDNVDFTKEPMFLGRDKNLQRYDVMKYPAFDRQTQTMLSYFWRPEEVSLQNDRNDYLNFRPEHEHIFTSNLKYQALLDSVQGRGPAMALLPMCSLPELESALITWDFFENIHSRAYTYMLKNIYPEPEKVLDDVMVNPEIQKRAKSVAGNYNRLYSRYAEFISGGKVSDYELKELLFLTLNDIYILEGIRFYISFACSFAFGELKQMEGSAKIISLIARDENVHLALTQNILNNYKKYENDVEMIDIMSKNQERLYSMFEEAVQQEKEWAEYLFSDGSMIGLNYSLLSDYIEYIANKRMKAAGLKQIFGKGSNLNPLPWTEHWLNSGSLQVAPQETEVEQYLIGGIKQDINEKTFEAFSL
jgi:ribonucleoside-diphosphate reductase beta chain